MNFALKKLTRYCEAHTTPHTALLQELERETHLKTLAPQMMSGHLQGQLLSLLSKLVQPKIALEIGTFTGYAALCIAQGLPKEGKLYTIEVKEELEYIIRKYIERSGVAEKIELLMGDAAQIVPTLASPFDLVFLDAGKRFYEQHYDLVIDKVRTGGLIIADNVLWSGKVTLKEHDKDTQIIHAFNKKVLHDERVENVLLPIRDGINVIRKL